MVCGLGIRSGAGAQPAAGEPGGAGPKTAPRAVVLGLRSRVDAPEWREARLGMGIRGRLAQFVHDSGAFSLVEEKTLAASIQEAAAGYWLTEASAESLEQIERLRVSTTADWVIAGTLEYVGVTQDQVSGFFSARRWSYRVALTVCAHGADRLQLCKPGEGKSSTTVYGVGVEYRGNEVAFDEAGPAQAVDKALVAAFNALMPEWEEAYGR